jgi:uncharacterized protein (DUF488 family)
MPDSIFTIGHSNHSIEKLVNLLSKHGIEAIADVRSHPYSRFNPQFNREELSVSARTAGISYVFLGHELGARSEDRTCYLDGKVQYDRLARTSLFQEGLGRVAEGMKKYRIALLCAEKDPLMCHRTILICRHLVMRGVDAQHILEGGQLESHDEALERLLGEVGLQEGDLFRSRADLIDEAYHLRGEQIAYVEKERSNQETVREVLD